MTQTLYLNIINDPFSDRSAYIIQQLQEQRKIKDQNNYIFWRINFLNQRDLLIKIKYFRLSMRKEIKFELYDHDHYQINVKNIFSDCLNQIEDRIKRNRGFWCSKTHKFQISTTKIQELSKDIREVDRSITLDRPPEILHQIIRKHGNNKTCKKNIFIDLNSVKRFGLVWDTLRKNKQSNNSVVPSLQKGQKDLEAFGLKNTQNWHSRTNPFFSKTSKDQQKPQDRNSHHLLVFCPEFKVHTWLQLENSQVLLSFQKSEIEGLRKKNNDTIFITPFEKMTDFFLLELKKSNVLGGFSFSRIFVDEVELFLTEKMYHEKWENLKKATKEKQVSYFASNFLHSPCRLQLLVQLLTHIIPNADFSWLKRRYCKDNYWQLSFLLKICGVVKNIQTPHQQEENKPQNQQKANRVEVNHLFQKMIIPVPQYCQDRIRATCKRFAQLDQKKILQNVQNIKHKLEKQFYDAINDVLIQNKADWICRFIKNFTKVKKTKCVVIIENPSMYRAIQNYLCEQLQNVSYCHYQHPKSVIEFNRNPSMMICLVRVPFLLNVKFGSEFQEYVEQEIGGIGGTQFGEQLEPEQYQCIGMASNVIFPDPDWCSTELRSRQIAIRNMFRYIKRDLVRHYFINKGTYEMKWMDNMQESSNKIQLTLKLKDELMEEEELQQLGNQGKFTNVATAFQQIQHAEVEEEYQFCRRKKGVLDIDEEFDKVEFEAMKQREQREKRKKQREQLGIQFKDKKATLKSSNSEKVSQKINKKPVFENILDQIDPQEEGSDSDSEISIQQGIFYDESLAQDELNSSEKQCDIFVIKDDEPNEKQNILREVSQNNQSFQNSKQLNLHVVDLSEETHSKPEETQPENKFLSFDNCKLKEKCLQLHNFEAESESLEENEGSCKSTKNQESSQMEIMEVGNRKLGGFKARAGVLKVILKPERNK